MSDELPQPPWDEDELGEWWDDTDQIMARNGKMTVQEWLDLMTPTWQEQLRKLREQGYMNDQG